MEQRFYVVSLKRIGAHGSLFLIMDKQTHTPASQHRYATRRDAEIDAGHMAHRVSIGLDSATPRKDAR